MAQIEDTAFSRHQEGLTFVNTLATFPVPREFETEAWYHTLDEVKHLLKIWLNQVMHRTDPVLLFLHSVKKTS